MSFYDIYNKYKELSLESIFSEATENKIKKSINKDKLEVEEFISLLSPEAEKHLEEAAIKANKITKQYFGRAIQLYTPMYLANYCVNECAYCGFNTKNNIPRRKLSLEEVKKEAEFISKTGLKHILILTGESREHSPKEYIKDCIKILRNYFSSISIEIYPLTEEEYSELISEGVDGLTIYQEVYDQEVYDKVHLSGPKKDYRFRLDAPERACKNNIRTVNIGSLLGLADFRKEAFMMGLHAKYLQDKYPDTEISLSIPRLQSHEGNFKQKQKVTDKNLVQVILALRLFLPRIGITLSTRESKELRDNLLPLGITKISAGSTTAVGGHTIKECNNSKQFDISDKRDIEEIKHLLLNKGYQPVLKDWMEI